MSDNLSPAMRQYFAAKSLYPEAILFFRMGDFYEMFFEDAEKAAPLLDIALTSRSKREGKEVPMCGVPYHAVENYITKLTDLGIKVAVCDQLEDASQSKGVVARGITRVATPGVILSAEGQVPTQLRFLAALVAGESGYALAGLEVSTGDLILGRFDTIEKLREEILAIDPHECLLAENAREDLLALASELNLYVSLIPQEEFAAEDALKFFLENFGRHSLESWDLEKSTLSLSAAGLVLNYAKKLCCGELKHIAPPRLLWRESYMGLDEATLANLEILKTLRGGQLEGSLLGLMDKTVSPMGSRLLRSWLVRPLLAAEPITARHGAVDDLLRDGLARARLLDLMRDVKDMERSLARLTLGRGGPRDLSVLRDTVNLLPAFKNILTNLVSERLLYLGDELPGLEDLFLLLKSHLSDHPPLNTKEGGLIKRGVSAELDELLDLEKGGKDYMLALEAREREKTGITSLKIGFNRVYGYYLEVTKTNLALVPDVWIRKQTIANGERYITPELKEWEEKILNAGEKRLLLEEKILEDLRLKTIAYSQPIKKAAQILAELDVLIAFSVAAEKYDWRRPILCAEDKIEIKGGRHPVVEESLPAGVPFVANDISLNYQERFLIITGPNMAGKSTILRQTALIVLMNQVGSFVPADSATLSLRDRIFTRVGAADDLARGRSTFMVEMNETARILSMASTKSLVVLDEVGRGTSTYDGLSIAWAVSEYLHDLEGLGVPTLFATHYHELVALAKYKKRVRNYNVSVKEWQDRIIFLRNLCPGGASRSYGLAVAALAGIPKKVMERAKEVLADLSRAEKHLIRPAVRQLDLFEEEIECVPEAVPGELLTALRDADINSLSPLEALNLLAELKKMAQNNLAGSA